MVSPPVTVAVQVESEPTVIGSVHERARLVGGVTQPVPSSEQRGSHKSPSVRTSQIASSWVPTQRPVPLQASPVVQVALSEQTSARSALTRSEQTPPWQDE